MIPVFQTRYEAATFGNCFEACIASILELPLAAVPDRAQFVDLDAWADLCTRTAAAGGDKALANLELPASYGEGEDALRAWLADRGLAMVEAYDREDAWFVTVRDYLPRSYWIAHTREGLWQHATVWRGEALAHNPDRNGPTYAGELGDWTKATLLVAGDPPTIARRLDPLPDVAAQLAQVAA